MNLGLVQNNARVLVVNEGASHAVVKILMETELKEAGDIKATKKEKENTIITAKYSEKHNLLVLFVESNMESQYCGPVTNNLWSALSSKKVSYIGLRTTYKTNYSTFDGHISIDSERSLPIRFIKSSKQSGGDGFVPKSEFEGHVEPDNFFNQQGSFFASILMQAEMYGGNAIGFRLITDQHFVTLETLQSFLPIFNLSSGLNVPAQANQI